MTRSPFLAALAIALGLIAAGCSDSPSPHAQTAPPADATSSEELSADDHDTKADAKAEGDSDGAGHDAPDADGADHKDPDADEAGHKGADSDGASHKDADSNGSGSASKAAVINLAEGGEFALVPKVTKVPAGRVDFTVENLGAIEHEVLFVRTDADSGDLPPDNKGGASEAGAITPIGAGHGDGSGSTHVGTHFHAGGTGTVSVNLPPGRYAVICNLPGHYAAGMHASIEAT